MTIGDILNFVLIEDDISMLIPGLLNMSYAILQRSLSSSQARFVCHAI